MENNMTEITNINTANALRKLAEEVETYKQAVQDAKGALASAENELDELLAASCESGQE